MIALTMTFMDEPMAKNMSFQREYAEPYDWVAQQFKDWAFTLTTSILYYNDYDSIDEEHLVDSKGKEDVRTVLHLHPFLAPYKAAVLPLSKKLSEPARKIQEDLSKEFMIDFDDAGSIGKRYRREDEIGTPYCITVDFATVGDENTPADNAVTIRDRDTMEQVRVPIDQLKSWLEEKLAY